MSSPQLPEAGRAGRFSSASARNRGGGLLAPPPRVQAREAQRLRSDFFLVRISKSNLWGEGGRKRERGEEDGSLHPSLHPTLRKGELLSLSAERVQATSLTFGRGAGGITVSAPFPDSRTGSAVGDPTRPACRFVHSHLSDETATQLQPPTRPGDARIASNDGDKRTDELCLLLWRRCRALQRCQQIRSLHRATDWVLMITGGCSNYINQN